MRIKFSLAAVCLMVVATPGATATESKSFEHFMASQGCAIGPQTRTLAEHAGHTPDAIDALLTQAERADGTVHTGDWVVLPPSLCTIRPPDVRSRIRLDDPEVKELTSNLDAYNEYDGRGCFIDGEISQRVQETRGWSAETAHREYLRFIAENLAAGHITFYNTDPLRTPAGMLVLTGDCADVPDIENIRQSQAVRDRELDALIRADAENVICGEERGPSYHFMNLLKERAGDESTNAWTFFEVQLMAMGGGWFEGTSGTRQGVARPPMCRFK